jgi:response regulator RpfG family c-di-GMP phosphodiesterase
MDGYEATRRIKATTKGQATVIVALTASALEEDRVVILSEGCDAYVRKPFREDEIFEALTEHLGVQFRYEKVVEEPGESLREPFDASLLDSAERDVVLETLANMPADWISELQQATVLGNTERIEALVYQIRDQEPDLAETLAELAYQFNHDQILTLLRQVREEDEE